MRHKFAPADVNAYLTDLVKERWRRRKVAALVDLQIVINRRKRPKTAACALDAYFRAIDNAKKIVKVAEVFDVPPHIFEQMMAKFCPEVTIEAVKTAATNVDPYRPAAAWYNFYSPDHPLYNNSTVAYLTPGLRKPVAGAMNLDKKIDKFNRAQERKPVSARMPYNVGYSYRINDIPFSIDIPKDINAKGFTPISRGSIMGDLRVFNMDHPKMPFPKYVTDNRTGFRANHGFFAPVKQLLGGSTHVQGGTVKVAPTTTQAGGQHELGHYDDYIQRDIPFATERYPKDIGKQESNAWAYAQKLNNRLPPQNQVKPDEHLTDSVDSMGTYAGVGQNPSGVQFLGVPEVPTAVPFTLKTLQEDANSSDPTRAARAKAILDARRRLEQGLK
jgi:hypothetical protein